MAHRTSKISNSKTKPSFITVWPSSIKLKHFDLNPSMLGARLLALASLLRPATLLQPCNHHQQNFCKIFSEWKFTAADGLQRLLLLPACFGPVSAGCEPNSKVKVRSICNSHIHIYHSTSTQGLSRSGRMKMTKLE